MLPGAGRPGAQQSPELNNHIVMYFFNIQICMTFAYYSAVHPMHIGNIWVSILFFLNVSLNIVFQFLGVLLIIYEGDTMDILDVARVLESCLLTCHGLLCLVSQYVKRDVLGELLAKSNELGTVDDVKDETVKASCNDILRRLRSSYMFYVAYVTVAASIVFIFRPLISRGKYLVLIGYLPESVSYNLVVIVQMYIYITTVHFPVLGLDGIFLTMVILIQVQFKVLNHDLRTLFDEDAGELTEGEMDEKIGKWVDRHDALLKLVEQTDKVFSIPLLLYTGYITIGMCFELYLILTQEHFASGPYLVIIAVLCEFSFCYCVPAQILIDEAAKIVESAYESNWYKEPSSTVGTAMTMILMRSQKTVGINAVIVPINLMTCLNTLKSMVSYYMFLKTVGTEE